jgi:hypothetical protein
MCWHAACGAINHKITQWIVDDPTSCFYSFCFIFIYPLITYPISASVSVSIKQLTELKQHPTPASRSRSKEVHEISIELMRGRVWGVCVCSANNNNAAPAPPPPPQAGQRLPPRPLLSSQRLAAMAARGGEGRQGQCYPDGRWWALCHHCYCLPLASRCRMQ